MFFQRHFDCDDQKNVIFAPLVDCRDPCRKYIHWSFNNAEKFFIDVSFNTFFSKM